MTKERTDYTRLLPRTPPQGLVPQIMYESVRAALIYQCEWAYGNQMDRMLAELPPKKTQQVRVTCTECGGTELFEKATGQRAPGQYGFYLYDGMDYSFFYDGDDVECPFCGQLAYALQKSDIPKDGKVIEENYVMSADVLKTAGKELALICWNVQKLAYRDGRTEFRPRPCEAYVFGAKSWDKLSAWRDAYSGMGGYFKQYSPKWTQPQRWMNTWGENEEIFGLTPELIAESALPNCKLYEYMNAFSPIGTNDDVTAKQAVWYLRLYQMYPQIENLVVQGATNILDEIFRSHAREYQEHNVYGNHTVHEINWKENRPAQMLGLNKEEFARLRREGWSYYHYQLYIACREHGEILTYPDMVRITEFGDEEGLCIVGQYAPFGKIVSYLLDQILVIMSRVDGEDEDFDYYNDPPFGYAYLADYWDMAQKMGYDMKNKQVIFPRDLEAEHDRLSKEYAEKEDRIKSALMRERFNYLSKYTWQSDGLIIRPARSQKELKAEGNALNHCVARYFSDVALGKTAIFFIRSEETPKKSFFTLELNEKDLSVKQNRGNHNCDRTPEVIEFEAKWLEHIKEMENENGKRNRQPVAAGAGA